jgi:hypothetical protein
VTSIILWLIFGMGLRTHCAGGFSWSRFLGATAVKRHVGRMIGIPLTRSGRQRKIGSYLWRW